MANGLTHFDKEGNAVMVDVSDKSVTYRTALATGYISVGPQIMTCVTEGNVKKGDVLGVARVAGIMGVKKTSELIPMCHPLPMNWIMKRTAFMYSVPLRQRGKPAWKWRL